MILAFFFFFFFYLQVTLFLSIKFQVNWSFGSGEKAKNIFQDGGYGGHLRFSIKMILVSFVLQVTRILPAKTIGLGL